VADLMKIRIDILFEQLGYGKQVSDFGNEINTQDESSAVR